MEKWTREQSIAGLSPWHLDGRGLGRAADDDSISGCEGIAFVALVPHENDPAAGLEHAPELAQGGLGLEPVKCLGGQNRIRARIGKTGGRGSAVAIDRRGDAGRHGRGFGAGAHLPIRLDAEHAHTALRKETRGNARAGADVHHQRAVAQPAALHDKVDGCRWITRAAACIHLRQAMEPIGRVG